MKIELSEDHIYTVEGKVVPGVTTVLSNSGLIDTTWFTEEARQRGSDVHLACQLLDENDLDWDTVDPEYLPYLSAYQKFLDEAKPAWTHIEHKVYDPIYKYAGMVDRVGKMFGKNTILDLKTGAMQPWVSIQLAAYEAAYGEKLVRHGLQLSKDGIYKFKRYEDRNDIKIFRACLAIHNWREVNK